MIGNDWDIVLADEFKKPYFVALMQYLQVQYQKETIYPAYDDIFNALKLCSYNDTKVIILGQDPYHNPHQAHGLAFSVPNGISLPPSLINIYQELENDLGIRMSRNGNLTKWARQGVLLLNTVLTVRAGRANSHRMIGWEIFTDAIIKKLNQKQGLIFVLWGNNAIEKGSLIGNKHHILKAPHPRPLSAYRGFFGCKHFSKINQILEEADKTPIDWQV